MEAAVSDPTEGPPPLPEGSLLLHIGPPKTGSTAIQQAMHDARPGLAEHGVLYPGTRRRARSASWAVLGHGSALGRPAPRIEAWTALVDEIRRSDLPRVCLSHENFARADDAAAERILDGCGRDRTHVVYVARRLDKVLPSLWQEHVKAWRTASYDEYLHGMLDDPPTRPRTLRPYDVSAVIGRWASLVGPDRVTVVVADEHDRGLIPRTFEALLGLPAGFLVPPASSGSNTSLTWTEVEAIRRINRMAQDDRWTPREYWQIVQDGMVAALGRRNRDHETRIEGLPAWAFDRVAERADRQIDQVRDAGVRIVGDPEDLRVSRHSGPAAPPADVESVPLDVLVEMVRGAVDGARALHRRELRAATRRTSGAADELSGRQLVRLLARRAARRVGLRRR